MIRLSKNGRREKRTPHSMLRRIYRIGAKAIAIGGEMTGGEMAVRVE